MGSSVSGSLDKFAPISPAAALASGKVKLPGGPMGGVAGIIQEDMIGSAEAKQAQNAANMQMMQQQQDQQNQYNTALQQMMMGQQQRPSLYSPAPYANGGNVALRRKMFKLGGSASAHGTGLTSGLSFNQGGRVGMQAGGVPGFLANLLLLGVPRARRFLTNPDVKKFGAKQADEINARIGQLIAKRGGRTPTSKQLKDIYASFKPISAGQRLREGITSVGIPATYAAGVGTAALERADKEFGTNLFDRDRTGLERALSYTQLPLDFLSTPAALATIGQGAFKDPEDFDQIKTVSQLISGEDRKPTPLEGLGEGSEIEPGITVAELSELASKRQREDLEAAMAMYQDLIRGEDNTNKLTTLGDAAIAAGSALMEGEGYGGAAAAFNEPLAQARAAQQEADLAARGAAAQLAIGEDIASRQQDEALFAQLAAEGRFDTAEEIDQVITARKFGISRVLPEDDKGEVDTDALSAAGAGVYVDPKTRYGTVFIAVNSATPPETKATNDPEVAKQFAKS